MNTKKNKLNLLFPIICTIAFIIEIILFYNMGIYVDEYGTSPKIVYGGNFWLYMAWIKLFMLFGISIFSWMKFLKK